MTLASGARQFVVHEAFEMMWCLAGSYFSSFTPSTTVRSGLFAGAVITTRLAPAVRCFAASSRLVKRPVDSKTTSTPRSFHGSCAGSRSERTLNASPSTEMPSPDTSTFAYRLPSTESYFNKCARVAALVRSFTATKSMFASPSAARMMLRPMRPNPLMPTLTFIDAPFANKGDCPCEADKRSILMNPLAEGQTARLYFEFANSLKGTVLKADVPPLQSAHVRGVRRGVAVLPLSGDPLQKVRREPPSAPWLSSD